MLRIPTLAFSMLLAVAALSACATESTPVIDGTQPSPHLRSTAELNAYLKTTSSSPLDRLPAEARQRFVESLVFTVDGLASYRYADLQSLSATEVYQILRLFDVEGTAGLINARVSNKSDEAVMNFVTGGYQDHYCASRATCGAQLDSICTDNC